MALLYIPDVPVVEHIFVGPEAGCRPNGWRGSSEKSEEGKSLQFTVNPTVNLARTAARAAVRVTVCHRIEGRFSRTPPSTPSDGSLPANRSPILSLVYLVSNMRASVEPVLREQKVRYASPFNSETNAVRA